MRKYFSLLLFCSMAVWGSAQNVGDLYTASFDGQRTGLNSNMGNLTVPIKVIRAVPLPAAVVNPQTILPFENTGTSVISPRPGQSVVVLGDITAAGNAHYFIFGVLTPGSDPMCPPPDSPGCVVTIFDMDLGPSNVLDYVPSYAEDIVLLGGAATSAIKAVNIASMPDATLAWSDPDVGETVGRDPFVSGNLALYHGSGKVAAREADSGIVLWEVSATAAEAPLAMQGERVYYLGLDGAVNALNSADGSTVWTSPVLGLGDGSSIISTEKYIFLSGEGTVGALDARDGSGPVWSVALPGTLATNPGIALAYGQLFVFQSDNGSGRAEIRSYNPDCNPGCGPGTGQLLWTATDDSPGLDYAAVANNQIWYYNSGSGRVRVRDAFTGDLLWSISRPGLRSLALSDELVLFVTPIAAGAGASARGAASSWQVEVLKPSDQLFFAQMANGEGQSTLIALSNIGNSEIPGTVNFFDNDGNPLALPVDGVVGDTDTVPFSVSPQGSVFIQTLGGDMLQSGWISVTPACEGTPGMPGFNPFARCPDLRGSSLFQFSDAGAVLFEAGVRQSPPTGQAVIAAQLAEVPTPQGGTQVLSTGVAIANPADETANITLTLTDSSGTEVGVTDLPLAPGEHLARFIEELFPDDVGDSFQGTLLVESDMPVIITALRTGGGFQLSSFEVGQSQ